MTPRYVSHAEKGLVLTRCSQGGNTCLIIEDPPPTQGCKARDPRAYSIVVCSARTSKSLAGNQRQLYEFLKAHPHTTPSYLSYTTTARRMHHVLRRSYCTKTIDDLVRQVGADLSISPELPIEPAKTVLSVVFTFTGQGSIYPGMGKQLFESCARFRNSLPHILDIFTDPAIDLASKSTVQIQLAITFLEVATADLFMS